ncbi:MAG: hypothetical protein HC822_27815, partial [Oscillochloris sp.]|nr:hypothetical protein [Oscillochloris sp.]
MDFISPSPRPARRVFGRFRPWVTLLVLLTLVGGVAGAIFASGARTLRVALVSADPIPEGGVNATFRVSLSDQLPDGDLAITFRTQSGSGGSAAISDQDFTAVTTPLTFTAGGATSFDIDVPITDDALDELNEDFVVELVQLTANTSATIFVGLPQTVVIADNDSPSLLSISGPTNNEVAEGAGSASFTATIDNLSPQPVTLSWELVGSGADPATIPPAPGADVAVASGNWVINSGLTSRTFTIGIIDDLNAEQDEQFQLRITAVQNIANQAFALSQQIDVTIIDNDSPPTVTNNGLTVDEGQFGTITTTELSATDPDPGPNPLLFTIGTAPLNGTLTLDGAELADGSTFTQA